MAVSTHFVYTGHSAFVSSNVVFLSLMLIRTPGLFIITPADQYTV